MNFSDHRNLRIVIQDHLKLLIPFRVNINIVLIFDKKTILIWNTSFCLKKIYKYMEKGNNHARYKHYLHIKLKYA